MTKGREKPLNKLQAPYAVVLVPLIMPYKPMIEFLSGTPAEQRARKPRRRGKSSQVTYTASMFPAVGGATGDQVHGRPPNSQ